jgi:pimeloyl-ACP methyl ester carboxylesterase
MFAMRTPIRRVLPLAVLLLLVGGCGGGGRTAGAAGSPSGKAGAAAVSPTPAPSDAAGCQGAAPHGQRVTFGPEGAANLVGVVFGTGRTGMVLAHQSRADRCQWAVYAEESAKAGYRVLTFDFPGDGDSPAGLGNDAAVAAAAAYLRGTGAPSIVLIGASMGGNAVLAAAPRITPPVAGVISLSAPAVFQGLDAGAAVKQLAVPALYAVCQNDTGFAQDAAALYAATSAVHPRKLVVAPGCGSHGVQLADPAYQPEAGLVRPAIAEFLATYAPA